MTAPTRAGRTGMLRAPGPRSQSPSAPRCQQGRGPPVRARPLGPNADPGHASLHEKKRPWRSDRTDGQPYGHQGEAGSQRCPVGVDADIGVDAMAHSDGEQGRQRHRPDQPDHYSDGDGHAVAKGGGGCDPGRGYRWPARRPRRRR